MQYREWLAEVNNYSGYVSADISRIGGSGKEWSKPTEFAAEKITNLTKCLRMVDDAAKATDEVIGDYILTGVTTGMSYDTLNARCTIPCCKDVYYDLYRKFFFFILSENRK